jgi:sugar phosphate isomerase/epimerase
MKLAYSTLACPDWRWDQVLKSAVQYHYEGIELRLLDGEILQHDLPSNTRQYLKQSIQQAGLAIACVDTSLGIGQPDPESRKHIVAEGIAFIELAAELGAPSIRVFGQPPKDCHMEDAIHSATDVLTQLAPYGESYGVNITLETHDAFTHIKELLAILQPVTSPRVGLTWDIMNMVASGETVEDCIYRLGHWIKHVHVKDGLPPDWSCLLLGEGIVPMEKALQALNGIGYQGWISVEWEKKWHPELAEPEIAMPHFQKVLQKYLDAMNGTPV